MFLHLKLHVTSVFLYLKLHVTYNEQDDYKFYGTSDVEITNDQFDSHNVVP